MTSTAGHREHRTAPGGTRAWRALAEQARWAPSPHNTQPTRLRIVDPERAELWFVPERGLPVGDPRGRFTHVTFGIFAEILSIAAHGRGLDLEIEHRHEPLYRGGAGPESAGPEKVADLRLHRPARPVPDLDPQLITERRTSRHPYDDSPVPDPVLAELGAEARRHGHRLRTTTDPRAIRWVKELNRDALLHDLGDRRYREELASWLRFSAGEAQRRADGLSAEALALPGWLLRGVMRHHRLFSASVLRHLTQRLYMATMRGISTVGWIQGDFATIEDWTRAGRLMIRLWLILTGHGLYWQPYGSVITTEEARRSMVDRFGIDEGRDGRDMAWLLVRMGACEREPARSHRLPLEEVLL